MSNAARRNRAQSRIAASRPQTAEELAAAVDARIESGEQISTEEFHDVIRKAGDAQRRARKNPPKPGPAAGDIPETDPVTKTAQRTAKATKAKKAPKAKTPKAPRPKIEAYSARKDGSLSARGLTCLCGCGAATVTQDARFISGHDAKMRQTILAAGDAKARVALIPAIVLPMFKNGETVAGLRLAGSKVVDMKASKAEEGETEE